MSIFMNMPTSDTDVGGHLICDNTSVQFVLNTVSEKGTSGLMQCQNHDMVLEGVGPHDPEAMRRKSNL